MNNHVVCVYYVQINVIEWQHENKQVPLRPHQKQKKPKKKPKKQPHKVPMALGIKTIQYTQCCFFISKVVHFSPALSLEESYSLAS